MTNEERIKCLQAFGYEPEEAQFLCIAALHSGYFLRRQYLSFVSGTKGWKDVALLKKLKANRHCRVCIYRHNRMIYHLSAKPLYEALGERDDRNRREHQPSTIKNRIMALDFILDHPGYSYLATEREKLDYFVGTLKIAAEDLPVRWYESPRGREASAKYFADKYPVFLAKTPQEESPLVHFCYVDEGMQSTDRFETYLGQYSRLFAALPDFRVLYIAANDELFASAERVFEDFSHACGSSHGAALDPDSRRLLDYFEMRREYEAEDFSRFDTPRLIRYRESRKHFSGETYDAFYAEWHAGRNAVVLAARHPDQAVSELPIQRFSTHVLGNDYDLFGTLTR